MKHVDAVGFWNLFAAAGIGVRRGILRVRVGLNSRTTRDLPLFQKTLRPGG
jgi:hypothetical protein